ncbi:MAG: hypothetical protein ABJA89_14165 [Lapillicoccus sp.]
MGADLRVGGHHEPFVVVEPALDELDPRAVVPEDVLPEVVPEVVPEEVVPEEVVVDVEVVAVVLGVETAATVPLCSAA